MKSVFLYFAISLFLITKTIAQQNLVINSSFEEYTDCPDGLNPSNTGFQGISWIEILDSPDYYHLCGTGLGNINTAYGGGGGGQNGVAYSGLSFWVDVPFPLRELLQGNLETSLNPNHKYDCSFWIYLPDSFLYAVRNVGIYFSKTSLPVQSNTNSYFQYIPQVKYNGTSYLTEKNKWKQISGSFIADGGEKFLTIGNFDSNALTDTMRVTGGTNYNEWRQAYYYIDNISVIEDTSYHPIGIEEEQIVRISIAIKNGYLQTQGLVFEKQTTQVKLYNLEGKLGVEVFTSPTQREVPIQNLSEGVYFYSIEALGKVVKRGKVVVGL